MNVTAEIYYPTSDNKNRGQGDFHFHQIKSLHQALQSRFAPRSDVYISSGIFVYYVEGNARRRFSPDLMICFGIENKPRYNYKLWEEKAVPAVIFEIVSSEDWSSLFNSKRRLYTKLGVSEYYVFDSEYKYLPEPLRAYRLEFGDLVHQSIVNNRIFSPMLNLELVDTGKDLRLFDCEKNELLPNSMNCGSSRNYERLDWT